MSDASKPQTSSSSPQISPEAAEKLFLGEISPGQFLGFSQQQLYKIAISGHEMLKSGNLQTALDIFKGLVAASPHDSVFHCNLAAVYVGMEDYEEAMKAYSRSIELNIANVDALVGRSELYLRAGKVPEALKDIEVAIKADPEAKKDNTKRARTTLMMLKKMAESAEASNKK